MTTPLSHFDPVELAELYAAGATTDEERAHFEARIESGDVAYLEAWERVREVAERLLHAAPTIEPPDHLRHEVLRRMGPRSTEPGFLTFSSPQEDPIGEDPRQQVLLRGDQLDWKDSPVPGVQTRNLFVDREHGRLTVLIKMDPGAVFPDHEHPGVEECMVVDGDLHIAGTVLRKFDYLRTPAGHIHGTPRTEGGCLLLVTCPLGDAA